MPVKILYLARFGQLISNQDEDAIAHALEKLGHTVTRIQEPRTRFRRRTFHPLTDRYISQHADFLLFHHYGDFAQLKRFPHPKVFWLFDLVSYPDETLASRNAAREEWLRNAMDVAALGFCTDGDAVARQPGHPDHPDRLHWLPQGADERVTGAGTGHGAADILFTGIYRGGAQRESFVEEMRARYGSRFLHVERGIHGRSMANLIAGHPIVVAPDGPITDRYTSNRVYNVLGFGGFLLHPYSEFLTEYYTDGKEIVYYQNREELHDKIAFYLPREQERRQIAEAGLARTLSQHLYRHRVERLLQIVQSRLL